MNRLTRLFFDRRGMGDADIAALTDYGHANLMDVDAMSDALHGVRERGDEIVVLPDFDCDGVMSGVVGVAGLDELGFEVGLFIPDPSAGYGFDAGEAARLLREHPGADAVITCDTGVSCREGAEYLKSRGVTLLVTDHHKEEPETTVRGVADVLVDPCRTDETYAMPGICGAHVFYQVLRRYAEMHEPGKAARIDRLRAFSGIGTVSDVMPMLHENREVVRYAIDVCRKSYDWMGRFRVPAFADSERYCRAFEGLRCLIAQFEAAGKLQSGSDGIDDGFFGYYLAPVINSVKRMGGSMADAFDLFLGDGDMEESARKLMLLNERRKTETERAYKGIGESEQPWAPYVYVSDAQPGILGLLASKIIGRTGVPAMVVREDEGRYHGSGRSPEWYPFLTRTRGLPVYAAGHEGAFGFGADEAGLDALVSFLASDVDGMRPAPEETMPGYDISIGNVEGDDVPIDVGELSGFYEEMQSYRPFGRAFEEPRLLVRITASDAEWRRIGRDQTHLKGVTSEGLTLLCWGQADLMPESGEVGIVGKLGVNEFNGTKTLQLVGDVVG